MSKSVCHPRSVLHRDCARRVCAGRGVRHLLLSRSIDADLKRAWKNRDGQTSA